jgi:hypothetical protein
MKHHLKTLPMWRGAFALVAVTCVACGGDSSDETVVPHEEHTAGHETERPPEDRNVAIEGLMGTISRDAVERGMEPRMGRFLRCFSQRYDTNEVLGGRIELAFRIRVDGSVLWVYPRSSSIGDRDTERCLLEQAASIRFSRPQGGEAEFMYPLDLETPEDVRPPLNWTSDRVASALETNRGELADCGRGPFSVTVYIAPGGGIVTAGASASSPEQAESLDCVARTVSGWSMPDPGSYPAKVSFDL